MAETTWPISNVLLVDANPATISITTRMLMSIGCTDVTEAHDSGEALLALDTKPFDAMIVDTDIAPLGAIALVRRLRADSAARNRDIPAILLALPDFDAVPEAREAGVTEFIRRPMTARILQERLRSAMSQPKIIRTATYVGPDRRRHPREPLGAASRIRRPPLPGSSIR